MAEINFRMKDEEDGQLRVEREVVSNEPESKVTPVKMVSVAFGYLLDNPDAVMEMVERAKVEKMGSVAVDAEAEVDEEIENGEVSA